MPQFFLAASLLLSGVAAAASYSVVDRIPGGEGDYDYVSFDPALQRVFVGRNTGVMTVDLHTRKVTMDFVKGKSVSAVLIIPGTSLMLSTNYEADTATLFDRTSGAVKANIPTGKSPDGALYDPATSLAFVMNGESADVTFIDIQRAAAVATVHVGGTPEAAAADGKGRLYVNIEDTATIAVIDVRARKVVGSYPLAKCVEPTGMAFDATSGLLISVCHNKIAKLIDAATGADKGTLRIGTDADGVIFDAARRLVYVPCKDGILSIFPLSADGKAGAVQAVQTERYARTAALDPETGRLFLPRSFELLIVAPK